MIKLRKIMNNCHEVEMGAVTLYFSYETCVGFHTAKTGVVLSENVWGVTTGKHLNQFGDKSLRIPRAEFVAQLEEVTHNA